MSDLRWPTYAKRDVYLDSQTAAGGCRVKDSAGREFLDAVGGIGCAPLGHSHPDWVDAVHKQMQRLVTCSNSYRTEPQQQLAAKLRELCPIDDALVFLASTGTESTEAAIKLALRATGRDTIIAFERAFHGRSLGALSMTANPAYRRPFISCPGEEDQSGFAHMRVLRAEFGNLESVRSLFQTEGQRIAAVMLEPVQGEGGVFPATREFLLGLRELCTEHGALLGCDEIQSGSGRTGKFTAWEAIVGDEAQPDIIWLAKALGAGFPVAACVARRELAEHMVPGTHGTTFGGNPVACAAAISTIDIIQRDGLMDLAAKQLPTLKAIAEADPIDEVVEIRGLGAMIGIQVGERSERRAKDLGDALFARGVLVTVPGQHTVRALFPYAAGEAELRELWQALRAAVEDTRAS